MIHVRLFASYMFVLLISSGIDRFISVRVLFGWYFLFFLIGIETVASWRRKRNLLLEDD